MTSLVAGPRCCSWSGVNLFITKLGCGTIADSSQHTATTTQHPQCPGCHQDTFLTPPDSCVSCISCGGQVLSLSLPCVVLQVLAGGSELTTTSVTSVLVVPVWDQCQAVCCAPPVLATQL